jgi:hypothetical protein
MSLADQMKIILYYNYKYYLRFIKNCSDLDDSYLAVD